MTIKAIDFGYEPDHWELRFTVAEQTELIRIKCLKSEFPDLGAAVRYAAEMVESMADG